MEYKIDKEQLIEDLHFLSDQGNYKSIKYALKCIDKLEKIEQIMKKYKDTLDNFYSGKPRDLLESDVLRDIKGVIENG